MIQLRACCYRVEAVHSRQTGHTAYHKAVDMAAGMVAQCMAADMEGTGCRMNLNSAAEQVPNFLWFAGMVRKAFPA